MKCLNCNLSVPDDAEFCPFCKAKIDAEHKRCPKCFFKLRVNQNVCPKCGYEISESEDNDFKFHEKKSEPENILKKSLKLFLKHKALYSSVLAILVVVVSVTVYFVHAVNVKNSYFNALVEYSTEIKESMKNVEMLAAEYNDIYDGEWLNQVNNISKLEKKYKDTLKECKSERDSINYLYNQLILSSDKSSENKTIKKTFKSYEKCYLYVIEKYGKYPGYMDGYKLLAEKYEADIKELDKLIDEIGK